jgi:hypothetical protein
LELVNLILLFSISVALVYGTRRINSSWFAIDNTSNPLPEFDIPYPMELLYIEGIAIIAIK